MYKNPLKNQSVSYYNVSGFSVLHSNMVNTQLPQIATVDPTESNQNNLYIRINQNKNRNISFADILKPNSNNVNSNSSNVRIDLFTLDQLFN